MRKQIITCKHLVIARQLNPKKMWKKVNELTNRNVKSTNINEISDDGNIVTEPRQIANIFNNFFTDIGPKLAKDLPEHNQIPESYVKPLNTIFRFQSVLEKLYSIVSISKELAEVNKQNSDTDCALGNSFISLAEATSKPDRKDKSLEEHMQSFENRLQALSKEFAANMSTVNNILWEHSNELKQINNLHPDSELTALKRENLELKNQNKDLTDRISNLNYILADLQGKAKAAEDDKASLITSVRLLCNDLGINQPSNGNYPLQDNRPPENPKQSVINFAITF